MSTLNSQLDAMTVTEVAEILEVNEESVRRWIRENKLAADKKLGRAGHTIYLSALVDFANKSSGVYQNKLMAWLKKENIPFEFTKASSGIPAAAAAAGTASLVAGPVGAIAAGVVGYMLGANSSKITLKKTEPADTLVQPPEAVEELQDLIYEGFEFGSAEGPMEEKKRPMILPIKDPSDVCTTDSNFECSGSAGRALNYSDSGIAYDDLMEEVLLERYHQKKVELRELYEQVEAHKRELAKLEVRIKFVQNELDHCDKELKVYYREVPDEN